MRLRHETASESIAGLAKLTTSRPADARNPSRAKMTAPCIACMRSPGFRAMTPQMINTIPTYAGINAVGA